MSRRPERDETPVVAPDLRPCHFDDRAFELLTRNLLEGPCLGEPQPDGRRRRLFDGLRVCCVAIVAPDRPIVRARGLCPPLAGDKVAQAVRSGAVAAIPGVGAIETERRGAGRASKLRPAKALRDALMG